MMVVILVPCEMIHLADDDEDDDEDEKWEAHNQQGDHRDVKPPWQTSEHAEDKMLIIIWDWIFYCEPR